MSLFTGTNFFSAKPACHGYENVRLRSELPLKLYVLTISIGHDAFSTKICAL